LGKPARPLSIDQKGLPMKKGDRYQFPGERYGRPLQCSITSEALAQISGSKTSRLSPTEMESIYTKHQLTIDRMVEMMVREIDGKPDELTITSTDVQRLKDK
jgi:Protein of unknown function (DUF1488)